MSDLEGECKIQNWSPSQMDTMSIVDRGDAPAQLVIENNIKARSQRQANNTKEELHRITARVDKTMAAFELNEELMDDNKAAIFVPDLLELEKIISDTILKRRYQQQVMIFVVGFEEVTGERLKLLTQINDFFGTYMNTLDEDELKPKSLEVDLEEVSVAVQEALDTASSATQKLSDINSEILSYVEKMTGGKAASKSKKKLEKALQQAKEDIMSLTDRLVGAQADIEDKEDQMTRLYKQIDLKNMEVMKHKNNAEQAKKKLEQLTDLELEISVRDEEIDRLKKALDDSKLSLKQLEHSKENSFARLKAMNEDGEQTIAKLQHKIQALNVQHGDVWNESQKQFEVTLQRVREEHSEELESLREALQAKIDKLEEEALNQPKGWASDSDDERDLTKSYSRKSSGRSVRSGVSTRSKKEPLSRQGTDISVKPTPPETPKVIDPPTLKTINRVAEDDNSRNKSGTPKRPMRNKSNLEPVHEVPFEEKIPIEDEDRWSKVLPEQLPSAFKQYRKEALFIVQGLQTQIKTNQEENHKRVKQLRNHITDKENKWDKERHILTKQVEVAKEAQEEAEKDADKAMAQLESFVKEHEETTKNAMKQEQKALKQLTPEQRAKYLGEFNFMNMVKPIEEEKAESEEKKEEEKQNEIEENENAAESEIVKIDEEEEKEEEEEEEDNKVVDELVLDTKMVESTDQTTQVDPVVLVEQEQQTSRMGSRSASRDQSRVEEDGHEFERPSSASSHHSQQSLYEKFKAQLQQHRQDMVERRSRATSMHGSLLSARSAINQSRNSTVVTTPQGDIPFPAEVEKLDIGTSPMAYSASSKSSRNSVESIADHPVVVDYLKTYQHVADFKENVMKLVNDKDFGAALEQLAELKTIHFNRDINVTTQISDMTYNVERFLKEIISVFGVVMTTPDPPEPAVSSLMVSRAETGPSRGGAQGLRLPSAGAIQEGLEREVTEMTNQTEEIRELQENYDQLRMEATKQQMEYEDKLNQNTMMMMELQTTIQDLQLELQALGGSKPVSSASRISTASKASRELQVEPTIIFSRSDSERNQRALKRGISAQRVTSEQYNEAVRSMEQYTVLPAKRLVHMVRKFSHHTEMKRIEENVRRSNVIDDEVFTLLEKMEALQRKRAQRWGEEMDALTAERNRLAHLLMESLSHLEQESGIFLIKPILSWKGRGFHPVYQSKLGNYQPPKRYLRPLTPDDRKGTPFTIVPAPTPANNTKTGLRPTTRNSSGSPGGGDGLRISSSRGYAAATPIKGSSVQMVGEVPQPMWSMSTSLPTHGAGDDRSGGGGLTTGKLSFMTTPRLLELDVNRLLIGQNTVTAATKALLSNDRLVNAANSSVRSYVTVARPSTHPHLPDFKSSRPNSTGEIEKVKTSPNSPLPPSPSSAGTRGRKLSSEGALPQIQPLPPIKVPSNEIEDETEGNTSNGGEEGHQSTTSGLKESLHPSPPNTPPGSSLRNSPAGLDNEFGERESHTASPGNISKLSLHSTQEH